MIINIEHKYGFEIRFSALPEDTDPSECFDDAETIEQIRKGELTWFCAEVTAHKEGVKLGSDYLGGCSYKSEQEFCTTYKDDYYADMVERAILEAKGRIARLAMSQGI